MTPQHKIIKLALAAALLTALLFMPSCNDITRDTVYIPEGPETQPKDGGHDEKWLFDMDAVPMITISVTRENWEQFLKNCDEDINNDIYVPAAFDFDKNGEHYHRDSVGLRLKGNTSRRRPEGVTGEPHNPYNPDWHHCHLGIRFNEYATGSRFCKTDRIVLKWFKDDGTYCREVYAYDLMQRFGVWVEPLVSYTRVTLNVEGDAKPAYLGVFAMIEGVHKGYIKTRKRNGQLPDTICNLWKCSWGADLSNMNTADMGIETPNFHPLYDLKTNKENLNAAKQQLASFINNMVPLKSGSAELKAYLEQNMDIDQFLRALAVNCIIGSWDDYWRSANNYYCMFDSRGKFYYIPFDLDNVLGTSQGINSGTQDLLNWGSRGGDRMLVRKVLSIKEYENQYVAYLHELADTEKDLFAPEKSMMRIKRWQNMIAAYIDNDTGEDTQFKDEPAWWAECGFYRLLSGNDKGGKQGDANFFKTRVANLPQLQQ